MLKISARAKLNLTLDVTSGEGGFHNLDSLVVGIDLCDELWLEKRADGKVVCQMDGAAADEGNSAVKAARALCQKFSLGGCNIYIEKHIPMGAGLGGSSADGAAAVEGLVRLYGLDESLANGGILLSAGSDGPVMYRLSGLRRMRGRGEKVESIEVQAPQLYAGILTGGALSTKSVFDRFDSLAHGQMPKNQGQTARFLDVLNKEGFLGALRFTGNALTDAAVSLDATVVRRLDLLRALKPLAVSMTGSGSAVFGIFDRKPQGDGLIACTLAI